MIRPPRLRASRKPTMVGQFRDSAHAQASSAPGAAVRRRSPGRLLAILLLVLAPLGLAAFLMLGPSGQGPDPGLSGVPDLSSVSETKKLAEASSPSSRTGSITRASLNAPAPAPGAEAGAVRVRREANAASEPLVMAVATSVPEPPAAAAEPPRPDVLASSDTAQSPAWSPFKPPGAVRGVTDKEIRLGVSAPFSGSARELGRQMRLGLETAFNLANDAGGVHGRLMKLIALDDGYEPTRTAETMRQLYEEHQVFGLIGNVGTPTGAVALPYALQRKMLFFAPFTGANMFRAVPPDRYVFNYRPSYAEETEAAVRHLVRVRGIRPREIAVFAQQDAFGDDGFSGAAKALRALQGGSAAPVLRLGYQRNSVDVADAVTRLRAANPAIKAVIMVATYRAAAKFIEATRAVNPKLIYTNVSFVGSTALRDELMLLGPKYADGVVVTQTVPAVEGHSKAVLDYKAALAKYFPGEAPDYVSFEGYVAARILLEGLRRAGPQLDTEKLVDTLEGIQGLDLGLGTTINFSPSEHQGSHKVWGTQLDNAGRYNPIELE